jgi:hypothetical protein
MKTTALLSTISLLGALAGCASTEIHSTVLSNPSGPATASGSELSSRSASIAMLTDAISCMSEQPIAPARCAQIAGAARVSPAEFAQANAAATDQVSEYLAREAARERLPLYLRTASSHWFDLAAGAAREARIARTGTEARRLVAAGEQHASLEEIETARRDDAADARAHAQLDSLFALAREGGALSSETQASALLLFAQRIQASAHARPEVRDDALAAIGQILSALRESPESTGSSNASAARAHEGAPEGAATLAEARGFVAEQLDLVAPRVGSSELRTACERTAEQTRPSRH